MNSTGRLLGKKATDPDEGGSPEGTPPKQIRLSLNKMTACAGTEMSSHYSLDTSTRTSSEPFARNTIETSTRNSLEPSSVISTQNDLEMPTRDNTETAMPALAGSSQEVILECPLLAGQPLSEDSGDSGQEQTKALATEQPPAASNAHASKEAAAAVAEGAAPPTMKRDAGLRGMSQAVCPVVTVFEDLVMRRQQLREAKKKNQEEEEEEEEDEDVAWSLVLNKKEKNYALFW